MKQCDQIQIRKVMLGKGSYPNKEFHHGQHLPGILNRQEFFFTYTHYLDVAFFITCSR